MCGMANRGELYSARLDSENENRYYFFNVKKDRHGTLFMTIVESTKKASGGFMRNEIFLYEEDMHHFRAELDLALNRIAGLRSQRRTMKDADAEPPYKDADAEPPYKDADAS